LTEPQDSPWIQGHIQDAGKLAFGKARVFLKKDFFEQAKNLVLVQMIVVIPVSLAFSRRAGVVAA
jgi:hypothetical protein